MKYEMENEKINEQNEQDTIRSLFDGCFPSEEQVQRMECAILENHTAVHPKKGRGKLRLIPAIAAVLMVAVAITAIASSLPVIKRYFFPGVGIIEVDETTEAAPLYLLANQANNTGTDFTCIYGMWHDNSAFVWVTSETRYDERSQEALFGNVSAELKVVGLPTPIVTEDIGSSWLSAYHIFYNDVTWEQAAAGLPLGEYTVVFTELPAEYRNYTVEDKGMRLELIPLTDDLTTFAAKLSYLDGRENIYLKGRSLYSDQDPLGAMYLIDAEGNRYPMSRRVDNDDIVHIFAISETPAAEIVGFSAEYLSFGNNFKSRGEELLLEFPLPEDGESVDVNFDFVCPDGVTPGRIRTIGYNSSLEQIDRKRHFAMGYRSVIIEAVEQDGIWYWCLPYHSDDYNAYLEQFLVEDTRSHYDMTTPMDPMVRIHITNMKGLDNAVEHMEHYVPDGSDTITIAIDEVNGIVWGDWNIDF